MLSKLFHIIEWVSKIVLILVSITAILKYSDDVEQRAFDRTYNYFQSYTTGTLQELRVAFNPTIKEIEKALKDGNTEKAEEVLITAVEQELFEQYITLINHFDTARECIKISGCDKELLMQYFQEFANSVVVLIWPAIEKNIDEYGIGVLCFSNREDLWEKLYKPKKEEKEWTLEKKCWGGSFWNSLRSNSSKILGFF